VKLYVLIDEKYDSSYRAVQGGHAVAEYMLRHPDSNWKNQTLIFLKCNLQKWMEILREMGKEFT
jgi:hypothetical protein